MIWVEVKYIQMVGARLRNFQRKGPYLWNMSCPFCGDSKRRKKAARGYIYRKGDHLNYGCKKCGCGRSARNFIKDLDPHLYSEMHLELFAPEKHKEEVPIFETNRPVFKKNSNPYSGLIRVSELPDSHSCKVYVKKRLIPTFCWNDLYYIDEFYGWANKLVPGKYKLEKGRKDEARLIIPMINMKGEVTGFQARQLHGNSAVKYISIALADNNALIWGLNNIDPDQTVYVFEGPIDAMFVPNSIACCGGDLIAELFTIDVPKDNLIIVYDNEPRSPHTIKKMEKAIERGFAVCIWPQIEEKDVNKMVEVRIKYGLPEACEFVFRKINDGIHRGPAAIVALNFWKKTQVETVRKPLIKKRSNHK